MGTVSGVRRSVTPHSPQSYGGMFLRRRAPKFVAEVPMERNERETRRSERFIFDLERDEPSSNAQLAHWLGSSD